MALSLLPSPSPSPTFPLPLICLSHSRLFPRPGSSETHMRVIHREGCARTQPSLGNVNKQSKKVERQPALFQKQGVPLPRVSTVVFFTEEGEKEKNK